jgi:hypothetical protein
MEHTINIDNKIIQFKFNESANCWQTKTLIDNHEIEIEIDFQFHRNKEIDWTHFKDFFVFVNKEGLFGKLINDSKHLVEELGKAYYRNCINEVYDFKMEFNNSIFYNGRTDGNFTKNGYSYSLIFNYYAKRDGGIYADDYGIYLVDIENHFIVGARRHQC